MMSTSCAQSYLSFSCMCCLPLKCNQTPCLLAELSCARDVLILVEDSTDDSSGVYIKQYLSDFVNSIQIGDEFSLVSLALFDNTVHTQWHLNNYVTSESLISNIDDLRFRHRYDVPNFNELSDYVNEVWVGDRDSVPDIVIVIADHDGTSQGGHHGMGMHAMMHHQYSSTASNNVVNIFRSTQRLIAINVGNDASVANAFLDYATDVYNIGGHHELATTLERVLNVFCH